MWINIREHRGGIKNGQSRDPGNIWYTKQGRRKSKQKHNTICVGHHILNKQTQLT